MAHVKQQEGFERKPQTEMVKLSFSLFSDTTQAALYVILVLLFQYSIYVHNTIKYENT